MTETTTSTYRLIGRCKTCKKVHTAEISRPGFMTKWCCTKHVKLQMVKATTSTKPCDGRCINAHGPSCDCQCMGKNHGAGWTA